MPEATVNVLYLLIFLIGFLTFLILGGIICHIIELIEMERNKDFWDK